MSCDKPGPLQAGASTPVQQAASNKTLAESFGNEFTESTETSLPPSYEVAIASAAADQTRGLEACQEKPAAEQKICKDEVNKTWAEASKAAEGARGNQQ
jgi:hypothetical protein